MAKVKICGNTNIPDTLKAKELGADFLGFIFCESKRKISVHQAREIMDAVGSFENFVGVFANQPKEEVEAIAKQIGLKWLQFHGDETSRYCKYFTDQQFNVIKTFRIKDPMSLKRIDEYDVTAFLFDTYSREEQGGSGKAFDWLLIGDKPYVHEKLFLAGGLTVDNLSAALKQVKPYAVDVASGVEKSPGIKDYVLLEKFIGMAKGRKPTKASK
ncbi:MAG TPA: phosphoribosylanthranilate isomerase [Candidatus Omnitrophota bacterium]|nr:phosphoribosylanthranilate isomerase [Candidatus Omnitrophota bacterium]